MKRVAVWTIGLLLLAKPSWALPYFKKATIADYVERYGAPRAFYHYVAGITSIIFRPEVGITMALEVDAQTMEPIGEWAAGHFNKGAMDRKYWPQHDLIVNRLSLKPKVRYEEMNKGLMGVDVVYTFADGTVLRLNTRGNGVAVEYPGRNKHQRPDSWEPTPGPIPSALRPWFDEAGQFVPPDPE